MAYDSETKNGVKYKAALYARNTKYELIVDRMDQKRPAYLQAQGQGQVQSYMLGNRNLTRKTRDPEKIIAEYEALETEKLRIESGRSRRKAVGIVLRDW